MKSFMILSPLPCNPLISLISNKIPDFDIKLELRLIVLHGSSMLPSTTGMLLDNYGIGGPWTPIFGLVR